MGRCDESELKAVFFLCQAVARQFINRVWAAKSSNVASMLSFQGGIRAFLHRFKEWGKGYYHADGQRMGQAWRQCQCHCPHRYTDNTTQLRADEAVALKFLIEFQPDVGACRKIWVVRLSSPASKAGDYVNGYTIASLTVVGWLVNYAE